MVVVKKGRKMYKLITITGQLGSGKSTVAKMLATKLGWVYYSTGMAQRVIAQSRGITTIQLNRLAITDPSIDHEIDSVFKNPPWGKKPCVVDSRLAWHFLPKSLKVCLRVDTMTAAQRVLAEKGRISESYSNVQEAESYLKKRMELEQAHFMKNYHLDITDLHQFDLVIDTTCLTPDMVCEKIIEKL